MQPKQLSYFPKLQTALSSKYGKEIESLIYSNVQKSEISSCLNIYLSFVDICVRKSDALYGAVDIRNSEIKLNTHLSALIGYIYTEIEASSGALYKYVYNYKKVFSEFASHCDIDLQNIKISDTRLSYDAKGSVKIYQSMNINTSLVEYYSCWTCEDKIDNSHALHLATCCDAYGVKFTTQIHAATSDYAKKNKPLKWHSEFGHLLRDVIMHLITVR